MFWEGQQSYQEIHEVLAICEQQQQQQQTLLVVFPHRTKSAFDAKMQKACKSTDFRVPLSVCTMFNVLMDAKKQCSKLCVLDTGQEVRGGHMEETSTLQGVITLCCSLASS